jgi:hypothetical protein
MNEEEIDILREFLLDRLMQSDLSVNVKIDGYFLIDNLLQPENFKENVKALKKVLGDPRFKK